MFKKALRILMAALFVFMIPLSAMASDISTDEQIYRLQDYYNAIDEYLDLETTAENIDMINGVIRQELSGQLKALGNRLAGLINRLTIISAAGYYANIAIIADLIDQDRYSSFEKIVSSARKRAVAFAN